MIELDHKKSQKIYINTDQENVRFAIVSDTHVPDRVDDLHPKLLPLLQGNEIDVILHCGDVIDHKVIDDLSRIAPVLNVLGNRDAFFSNATYPFKLEINVFTKKIGMYHGFYSIKHYFPDKIQYILHGYHFEKYFNIGRALFPDADVLCFGHTHTAEIRSYPKQLVINPGTAGPRSMNGGSSFSILTIQKSGKMKAELISLYGFECTRKHWVKDILE